ncbi:MAG: hypothetical protein ACOC89_03480 [Candidatus Saliniplasma sp.]
MLEGVTALLVDMAVLFLALLFVKWDIKKQGFDNKVYMMWLVGTMIGYFFYWMYGAALALVIYLVVTRIFELKKTP